MDDDGNGFLHYPHFMIVYAFVMSDANENGLLNVSDLKTLAETFYSDLMTDQDVEEEMADYDVDGDKQVYGRLLVKKTQILNIFIFNIQLGRLK